jgi:hypothetical protein
MLAEELGCLVIVPALLKPLEGLHQPPAEQAFSFSPPRPVCFVWRITDEIYRGS